MKKIMQYLSTVALTLFFLSDLPAQESVYVRSPGYWTFGINAGLAFQQSDVATQWDGWGLGLTLAKSLYYKPGAAISFDARGRFLYNQTYGLDASQSFGIANNEALNGQREGGLDYTTKSGGPGFVYQNHRTEMGELALEGVLNFNRLREKTNVNLSLFAGIGLDLYQTKIDQQDFNGLYSADYLSLNPGSPVSYKKSFLRDNILDGEYETAAQGFADGPKIGLMPDLGIELGYQFTPRFSIGLGHKVTFARNDLLDGQKWKNDNLATGDNDIHHYTNLHFRWIVDAGKKQQLQAPVVHIIRPTADPYVTRERLADVRARILYVNSAVDVTCTVNGNYTNFNFQREDFSLLQNLQPGRNEVVITATNSVGRDQKTVVIIYEESIITPPPPPNTGATPRVRITNPADREYTTGNNFFDLRADIDNVPDKRSVSLRLNGREIYDFQYNASGQLSANLQLEKGRNYVQLKATTRGGTDEDDAIIYYEKGRDNVPRRPVVAINQPSSNPYRTTDPRVRIEARIDEVSNKRDIQVRFNGRGINNFSFDGQTLRTEVNLKVGENEIIVEAKNTAGRSSDSRRMILEDPYTPPPPSGPVVDFINPSQSSSTSSTVRYEIKARIRNVTSTSDIRFYHNGTRISNFNFQNEILTHSINLADGSNNVTIDASNRVGNDKESVSIRYTKVVVNTPKPPQVTITQPTSTSSNIPKITLEAKVINVSNKADLVVTLNGQNITNFDFSAGSGLVRTTLGLNEGSNRIVVKASNSDGSDQDTKTITYAPASNPPQVTITRPVSSTSANATINLEANILYVGSKNNISLSLNGQTVSNFDFNTKTKILTTSLTLKSGSNTIIVKANNSDGSGQDSKTITYTRASSPPQVTITQPSGSNTQSPVINLEAKISNISSKTQATVLLNGQSVSTYDYNSNSKTLTAALKLRLGTNTIIVKAQNEDGSDEDSKVITYTAPTYPPVVTITSPAPKSRINATSTLVKATIEGVTKKDQVKFYVNGKLVPDFILSGSSFSATAPLQKGDNILKITATNSDGSDDASVTVFANPPVLVAKPVVQFTNPKKAGAQVSKSKYTVKASIQNVASKSQINFKVDGQNYPNFTFDAKTGILSSALILNAGNTSLEISATNDAGSTTASSSLIYKVVIGTFEQKPTVEITAVSEPTIDPFDPNRGNSTITATTTNISSKDQVTFLLNGQNFTGFNFNASTKKIAATVKLEKGSNVIMIKVKNGAGEAEASRTVVFQP